MPNDGGSFKGLGESFSPLLSSGTATFSVPIALPPGRRGTQPSLAIGYISSGGNGPLGIGWSLAVPFVSRQTDLGLPRYDGTDRFMYNGGQELVEVAPADDADDADGDPLNGLQAEDVASFAGYRYFRARVECTSALGRHGGRLGREDRTPWRRRARAERPRTRAHVAAEVG